METVIYHHSSADHHYKQQMSPKQKQQQQQQQKQKQQQQQIKNTKNANSRASFISQYPGNFFPSNLQDGLLSTPPNSHSSPSSYSLFSQFSSGLIQQQPPLLPLPASSKHQFSNALQSRNRGFSSPPTNKKANAKKSRDQSLTPSKLTPSAKSSPRKEDRPSSKTSKSLVESSINNNNNNNNNKNHMLLLGPHPSDLPKDDVVSSVFFTISPPPSSLPLPTFFLRPKLSCNAEAAASNVDAGATDSLRRLLRLR